MQLLAETVLPRVSLELTMLLQVDVLLCLLFSVLESIVILLKRVTELVLLLGDFLSLALCDSGAEHASGGEGGAPSAFCAGLAEAGSRNQRSVVRLSDRSFLTLSRHLPCVDNRRSRCVEFARGVHCTNPCLDTHAARANSRGFAQCMG